MIRLAEEHAEARLLLWRLYYLQFLIEEMRGDFETRHYLWLYLDQHLPWLDALLTRKTNVPYHEVARIQLLPDCVSVMSEETVCRNAMDLQELLSPQSSRRPGLVQLILKTLPKRCICRNMEQRALDEFLETPLIPKIFRWMLLGNLRNAAFRPPLYARLRIWRASDEQLLQIARRSARTMTFALASFTACVAEELLPFSSVMSRQTSWQGYWRNVNLVCDCVIRPAFAKGRCVTESEIEQWQKKSSKPLAAITKLPRPRLEEVMRECCDNYKKRFSKSFRGQASARLCHLAVHCNDAVECMFSGVNDALQARLAPLVDALFREPQLNRDAVRRFTDLLTDVEFQRCLERLAVFNTSRVYGSTVYLKPLPIHYYVAQEKVDEKVYRMCPICFSMDFLVTGLKQSPSTFRIEPHTWRIICDTCQCKTTTLCMRGNMLVTPTARILCCTKCATPCNAKVGFFYGSDRAPFLCSKCGSRK